MGMLAAGFTIIYVTDLSVGGLGGAQSGFLPVTMGVPQGSILGPIQFTIYINENVSLLHGCQIHLYADDTILYCTADSV